MRSIPFVEAARITTKDTHQYEANLHGDYSYGPVAHGGFLVCLLWRAVASHFQTTLAKYNQPDTISLHVEFLRPVMVGDVIITISDTRLGKSSSTVHASMNQGGKDRVAAYFTNIDRSTSKGITMPTGFKLEPPIPAVNFDLMLENKDPFWVRLDTPYQDPSPNKALSNVIFRVEKRPIEDKRVVQSWLRSSDPDQLWTTDMLGVVCDMYIPALENFYDSYRSARGIAQDAMEWAENGPPKQHPEWDLPRWYITVNMTVDIKRALPEEGVKWLFTRMRTNEIIDGRIDVHGEIWDENGNLIALAQYLWFVVDVSRAVMTRARERSFNKESKM